MAGSWSSAIHNNQSADLALAATLNSSTNLQRISEIDIREKQVARLFAELGNSATPEIKTLLLDIASQVEGLCSVVQEPAGFSMVTFNEKRSELRVDLDKSAARASLLVPPLVDGRHVNLLDTEVETERARLTAALAERDRATAARNKAEAEAAVADRKREAEAQREAAVAAQQWLDKNAGLLWATRDNGANLTWDEAKSYCENLAVGGSDNWRMPSISELESLYDSTSRSDHKTKGSVRLSGSWVWSADFRSDETSAAWYFYFGSGERGSYESANSSFARALCVRRSQG